MRLFGQWLRDYVYVLTAHEGVPFYTGPGMYTYVSVRVWLFEQTDGPTDGWTDGPTEAFERALWTRRV